MRRSLIYVTAAQRFDANDLASQFAISPPVQPDFSVPLSPSATPTAAPTHYAACPDPGPELTAMLPALKANFPGSDYQIFENWDSAAGLNWLAGKGLVNTVSSQV